MNILIVAATASEVGLLTADIPETGQGAGSVNRIMHGGLTVTVLITGPGVVPVSYFMATLLATEHFDLAMNCGIGGSFSTNTAIGETVHVVSDCFADTGAVSDQGFRPLYSMNMAQRYKPVFCTSEGKIINTTFPELTALKKMRPAAGITVNTVSGRQKDIDLLKTRTNADVESMEGAAFFYACMMNALPCIQIRSISNYVAPRETAQWNIHAATDSLCEKITEILDEISMQRNACTNHK